MDQYDQVIARRRYRRIFPHRLELLTNLRGPTPGAAPTVRIEQSLVPGPNMALNAPAGVIGDVLP
jgi:hypothetical protein